MKFFISAIFATALSIVSGALFADAPVPDKYPQFKHLFPFGMYVAAERMCDDWNAPSLVHMGKPAIDAYRADLEDMAAHYVNVVAIENTSSIPLETLRKLIREGERLKMLTWASENGLPKDDEIQKWVDARQRLLKDERGLLAWSPCDEPYPEQMDRWLMLKNAFEKADPVHPVISVTCGGPKGFEKYSIVQAYDYYPVYEENPNPWDIAPMVTRYVNECYGKPIWFVQQAFKGEGRRMPTVPESRMMTYIALANGAKGIFYFIYDHLVDQSNKPTTPIWDDAAVMGRRLCAIGPEILDTKPDPKSKAVTFTFTQNKDSHRPKDLPSAVASVLKSPAGHSFVVVYNTSVEEPTEICLSVSSGSRKRSLYDLYDLTDGLATLTARTQFDATISPGDGRIYLLAEAGEYKRIADAVKANMKSLKRP